MYCKKCGSALPSHGFICKFCGTMMDSEQIKMQKKYMEEKDKEVTFKSDLYSKEPVIRNYKKIKENKYLGAILILLILIILIIIVFLKAM